MTSDLENSICKASNRLVKVLFSVLVITVETHWAVMSKDNPKDFPKINRFGQPIIKLDDLHYDKRSNASGPDARLDLHEWLLDLHRHNLTALIEKPATTPNVFLIIQQSRGQ